MSTKTIIKPAQAAPALGPYNHGVRFGDFLFCAGQIPIDPEERDAQFPLDIKAQTEQVLDNVKLILEDQNLTLDNVVKTTVYMTDLGEFPAMNEVYAEYFQDNFPARSTVQVSGLPKGARVEIEVIAHY